MERYSDAERDEQQKPLLHREDNVRKGETTVLAANRLTHSDTAPCVSLVFHSYSFSWAADINPLHSDQTGNCQASPLLLMYRAHSPNLSSLRTFSYLQTSLPESARSLFYMHLQGTVVHALVHKLQTRFDSALTVHVVMTCTSSVMGDALCARAALKHGVLVVCVKTWHYGAVV